jgi:hypothetical protein
VRGCNSFDLILRFCTVYSSIGNFLLAAAQSFFRSLPSAIFLFSSITSSQVVLYPFLNIRRPYQNIGEYRSCNYDKPYRYYRSGAGEHVVPLIFPFTPFVPCRRMERTLLGNARFPTQLRDHFHWQARMSAIRRLALTPSRQLWAIKHRTSSSVQIPRACTKGSAHP